MEEEVIEKASETTEQIAATATECIEKAAESMTETLDSATQSLGLDLSNVALGDLVSLATSFCTKMVAAIIVFLIGRFVIKRLTKLLKKMMSRRSVEASLFSFVDSLVNITLNFVLLIIVISILGIETSSFVALFASAGVAIGMALSGTLQNFAGGVMVLVFHPSREADTDIQHHFGNARQSNDHHSQRRFVNRQHEELFSRKQSSR